MEHIKDLKIKDSWDSLTISDFMMIEEINTSKNLNSLEKMIRILSTLSGVSDEYFNQFLITDISELFRKMDFLKVPPETKLKEYYTIGGKLYKMIGNFNDLSTGQFIDLSHFTKDPTGIVDNLHIICSIFLMPVVKKTFIQRLIEKAGLKQFRETENYLETPLAETADNVYKNMLYQDANAICLFFCVAGQIYTVLTAGYLEKEMTKQLKLASKMLSETTPPDERMIKPLQRIREKIISLADGVGFLR